MNYLFRIPRNIMMLMSRYLRGGFALAGAAKLLNFMQRADEMDAAQYNHRANKINKMHAAQYNRCANKINKMHLLRTNQVPFLSITNVAKF